MSEIICKFENEDFPLLSMNENLVPGGQLIGTDVLGEEAQGLLMLCNDASEGDIEKINEQELLFVEADNDSILQRIYAPAVWRTEDNEVVLRVGGNQFPVTQTPNEFKCGRLTGDLDFETKENASKEKYLLARIHWENPQGILYITNLRLDTNQTLKTEADCTALKRAITKAIKSGESIAPFLSVIGQGASTIAMQDLEMGEFLIDSITLLEIEQDDDKRTVYILNLEDGRKVWAKGGVARVLQDPARKWEKSLIKRGKIEIKTTNLPEKVLAIWKFSETSPVTLKVGQTTKLKNGNVSVACQLVERSPQFTGGSKLHQAQLQEATLLPGADSNADSDYDEDDIPF